MFNGHPYSGDNALRREADPDAPPQPGFLGRLVNDAALPPTDAEDIEYAQRYLVTAPPTRPTATLCRPAPWSPAAASKDLAAGEELLMSYTFGYDAGFMSEMMAKPELRKKMLTNAFAASDEGGELPRWNNSPPRRSKFTPRRSSSRGSSSWTPRETNHPSRETTSMKSHDDDRAADARPRNSPRRECLLLGSRFAPLAAP